MKQLLLALAVAGALASSACTTVQTKVTGTLLVERERGSAPEQFRYEAVESHGTVGLAVVCLLTAIYYGGGCWAYLALPFDDHEITAMEHARTDAAAMGRCVALQSLQVEGAGYSAAARVTKITAANGRELNPFEVQQLCEPPAPAAPEAPPPTPTPPAEPTS